MTTYTAWDLEPFARDCGYDGPPFRWDDVRRSLLRAELDAAFFHLYGINALDAAYILDTFPIVRRKDEQKYNGEYKTKTVILEIYDQLAAATRTGQPYQTRLNPPPGPPQEWGVESGELGVGGVQERRWVAPEWSAGTDQPANWPPHVHPPRGTLHEATKR